MDIGRGGILSDFIEPNKKQYVISVCQMLEEVKTFEAKAKPDGSVGVWNAGANVCK